MKKSFIERVKRELCVDTKKYRYILKNNRIYRIDQLQIGTTATLHFDDEFCQNGWKTVYKF